MPVSLPGKLKQASPTLAALRSTVLTMSVDPSPLITFALSILLPLLQGFVKNAKSISNERSMLVYARTIIDQVIAAIDAQAPKTGRLTRPEENFNSITRRINRRVHD